MTILFKVTATFGAETGETPCSFLDFCEGGRFMQMFPPHYYSIFVMLCCFSEQKIDGQALVFLSKEGSVAQLDLCGLNTIGDQMRLKELVSFHSETVPVVDTNAGRRNNKPSVMNIKQCSEMNQRIYKAK